MHDSEVRSLLQYLPQAATSSSSSSDGIQAELQRLRNRVQNAEGALRKRKNPDDSLAIVPYDPKGKGKGKGKDKNEGKPRRAQGGRAAGLEWLQGLSPSLPSGNRICFAYNRDVCSLARAGERCNKGYHLCPRCHKPHPLTECPMGR